MTTTETKSTVLLKHHLEAAASSPPCTPSARRWPSGPPPTMSITSAFLLQLCELELIERERKAAERRLKAGTVPGPQDCSMNSTSLPAPASTSRWCLQLLQGDYLDQRENIILVGPSGTGKTHLAISLGVAACGQGKKVRFFRVTELITLLLEAKEERQLLRLRHQLGKLDLLILDELGYVPASKAGAELVFDVIATRLRAQQHDRHDEPALSRTGPKYWAASG